jgi:hypothetical protein
VAIFQPLRLGAFASPWRAQQDDVHSLLPAV